MGMNCNIEYLSSFYSDLESITNFLSDYPKKAERVFQKADKSIGYLKEMPEMYPIYPDIPLFRFIVVEDYLVFYRFIEELNLVEIHRMIYGRMDIPVHLSKNNYKMTREEMLGCMRGKFKMADDFDAPLEDFKEYMYTDDELKNIENR